MVQKHYSIGELSEISGATVRTIQYYDQIGLLEANRTEANLRYYTQSDLVLLQQILFYKRLDFSLKEIRALVENVKNEKDLIQILNRQAEVLFRKEMEIKMNQVIIEVMKSTLEGDADVDLEPLFKLILGLEKQTILDYTSIDYELDEEKDIKEENIHFDAILDMYWEWKQVVLEASSLKLNQAEIESSAGYEIGEKWQKFLKNAGDENSEIRQVAEKGVEFSDQWPEEDLYLYEFSKDYIERSYQYYLKKKKGDKDG